jgi:hypothetical protein
MDSSGIYLEKNVQSSFLKTLENIRKSLGYALDKTIKILPTLTNTLQEYYIDMFCRLIKEFPKEHFVCAIIRKIPKDDDETLRYFVKTVLRQPWEYAADVWIVLCEVDWLSEQGRKIKNPYSYVIISAQHSMKKSRCYNYSEFVESKQNDPSLIKYKNYLKKKYIPACETENSALYESQNGIDDRYILVEVFALEEETDELVDTSQTEIGYIEETLSLEQTCRKANLKPEIKSDLLELLKARFLYEVTRDKAPEFLGWDKNKTQSVWRYSNLHKATLKNLLLS